MKFFFPFLLIVLPFIASAQISNIDRIEIDLKDDYYREEVHEFGKNGFVLSAIHDQKATKERIWKFDTYSTNLQLVRSTPISIESEFKQDEAFRNDHSLYKLLRGRKGAYKILSFESETQKYQVTDFELDRKERVKEMKVFNNIAYFLTRKKGISSILSVNLSTGVKQFYPIEIDGFSSKKNCA